MQDKLVMSEPVLKFQNEIKKGPLVAFLTLNDNRITATWMQRVYSQPSWWRAVDMCHFQTMDIKNTRPAKVQIIMPKLDRICLLQLIECIIDQHPWTRVIELSGLKKSESTQHQDDFFQTYQPSSRWNANRYGEEGSKLIECISFGTICDCACKKSTRHR